MSQQAQQSKATPAAPPPVVPGLKMVRAEVRRRSGLSNPRIAYNVPSEHAPGGTGYAFTEDPTTVEAPEEVIALLESKSHALHVVRVGGSARELPPAAEMRSAQATIAAQSTEIDQLKAELHKTRARLALVEEPENEAPEAPRRPAAPQGVPRMS